MAEITYAICTKNPVPVGPHCWHTVWRASSYQAGQHDSQGQRCCWCGADAPLTATYTLPIPHGPHAPASPQFTYHEPKFGHGGIPVSDVPAEGNG